MNVKVIHKMVSEAVDDTNLAEVRRVELDTADGNVVIDEWEKSNGKKGLWVEIEAPYGTFTIRPQNGCLVLSANWGNISIVPRAGNVFELRVA